MRDQAEVDAWHLQACRGPQCGGRPQRRTGEQQQPLYAEHLDHAPREALGALQPVACMRNTAGCLADIPRLSSAHGLVMRGSSRPLPGL